MNRRTHENASINELVPLNNDYFFNLADTLVKGMVNEESKSIELVEMVQPKFLATLNEKYDLSYIKSMVSQSTDVKTHQVLSLLPSSIQKQMK